MRSLLLLILAHLPLDAYSVPPAVMAAAEKWCDENKFEPVVYADADACKAVIPDLEAAYRACTPSERGTPNSKRGAAEGCLDAIESTFSEKPYNMILWAGMFAKSVAFGTHKATNGETACLEMTKLGHMMDHLTNEANVLRWGNPHTAELWGVLSRVFASKAIPGNPVLAGQSAPRILSFLWTAELPELVKKDGDLDFIVEWWADQSLPPDADLLIGSDKTPWAEKLNLAKNFASENAEDTSGAAEPTMCDWEIADRKTNANLDIDGIMCHNTANDGPMPCAEFISKYDCSHGAEAAKDAAALVADAQQAFTNEDALPRDSALMRDDGMTLPPGWDDKVDTKGVGVTSIFCKTIPASAAIGDKVEFTKFLADVTSRVSREGEGAPLIECKGGASMANFKQQDQQHGQDQQQMLRGGEESSAIRARASIDGVLLKVNDVLKKELEVIGKEEEYSNSQQTRQ